MKFFTTSFQQMNQSFIVKGIKAVAAAMCLLAGSTGIAQVNLISASDGGFENATTTPAANGWTTANSSGSGWICGSGAGAYAGSNSAYISSGGTTYGYTNGTNKISHMYRNVTIPAGVTGLTLSFQLKSGGTVGADRFFVSIGGASTTVNTTVTSGYKTLIPGATILYVQPALIPSYSYIAIYLPDSYAGTTVRLIFSWMNDNLSNTDPNPASIDNVSLTYATAPPASGACGYTFAPTGAVHSYSVPIGCSQLSIDAWGGAGGTCFYKVSDSTSWNLGGLGGRTQATVAVTPSTTGSANVLEVRVGGRGAHATSAGAGAGGYNGGGKGSDYNANLNGGGGGGASDIRLSPYGLADRIVVAGGGGGGGFNSGGNRQDERGGNGGATTGEAGYAGGVFSTIQAGQPGTPAAGGAKATTSAVGNDGALGVGGAGTSTGGSATGGGGGSGYYGGGSGYYGGGGGGSSYAIPGATGVTHTQGITPYNGIVYITPVAPTAFTVTTAGGGGCSGPGPTIGLSGSQTDVNYQLYLGGTAVGSPVTGTGSAISFGSVSAAGTYTVAAYYTGYSGCLTVMSGSATVSSAGPDVSNFATAASSPCLGNASTVTVTSSSMAVSTAYTVSYTLSGANTGSYTASLTFGAGSGTFTIPAGDLAIAGATTVTINTVSVTATGCNSVPATGNVANFNVLEPPSSISGGASGVCTGATTALSNTVSGGTWSSSMPAVATVSAGGVVSGVTPGSTIITYSTGCAPDAILAITVSSIAGTISGPSSVCPGAAITLSNPLGGGTWSSSNTAVASVDPASGVVDGIATGSAIISYTSGCTDTWTVNVLAAPGPISGIVSGICSGGTTTLSNPVAGGTWSSGSTAVATVNASGVVFGVSTGSAVITYSTGCGTDATETVTISSGGGTISGATSVCDGSSTTLSNTASGGTWSSSNAAVASVSSSGVVSGLGAGTVTISYSAGCTATHTMTVIATPGAISGGSSVCTGLTLSLSNTVAGGTWSSSAPGTAAVNTTTGVVTGVAAGSAVITYSTGCGTDATWAVNVISSPAAITGPSSVCAGSTISLTSATAGGTWSSSNTGVATIDASGTVYGASAGTTTITYSVGCDVTTIVTVNAAPGTISGTSSVCAGGTTALNNPVPGGTWSSSNPSVATVNASGVVSGVAAGTSTITYTTGCGTDATILVTVNPSPSVSAITGATSVCAGSTIPLSDATGGGVWSSSATGIASVNSTGVVSGVSAGTATISYSVTNSCGTTDATLTVTVSAANGGVITGADSVCKGAGHQVTLSASVPGGTWSSSNTARATVDATTGIVTGVSTGTFTITYVVSNACGTFTVTHNMYVRSATKCATGIAPGEHTGDELQVFPNPNTGAFTMRLLSPDNEQAQVLVTNVVGEKVQAFTIRTNEQREIQINNAPGFYLITVTTEHNNYVEKVMVVK